MSSVSSNGDIVTINGKKYKGRDVIVNGKEIWIDGVLMTDEDVIKESFGKGWFVFIALISAFSMLIIFG